MDAMGAATTADKPTLPTFVPALRHLAAVVIVLELAWLLPYAVPGLDDFRYLENLDVEPLQRAVRFESPRAPADPIGAMPGGEPPPDDNALAELDPALTANVAAEPGLEGIAGDEAEPAGPPGAEVADGPAGATAAALDPAAQAGATGLAASPTEGSAAAPAAAKAAPAEPSVAASANAAGVTDGLRGAAALDVSGVAAPSVAIEDVQRLRPFFEALRGLAHGKRAKVRVRQYGDSHLANDGQSHVLRVLMQRRFGDGGHGFVLAASRSKWYVHRGVRPGVDGDWKVRSYLGGGDPDDVYGYGGEAAQSGPGAGARIATAAKGHGAAATRLQLWWRGGEGGAELAVKLDGVASRAKAQAGDEVTRWHGLKDGGHRVEVRVTRGRPRLYGWVLERERGLVWDSLGVVGARERRWLNVEAGHLAAQVKERDADLLIMQYGSNSRLDKLSEARYAAGYKKALQRLRAGRDEPCLIIGPTDHGKRERGQIISEPRTVEIIEWQRKVATAEGCAFFDQRAVMGGDGSMGRWVKDGLGWADYAHLTPKGQSTLGRALYQALMAGLAGKP